MKTFRQHLNLATATRFGGAADGDAGIDGRLLTEIGYELPVIQPQLPALPAP